MLLFVVIGFVWTAWFILQGAALSAFNLIQYRKDPTLWRINQTKISASTSMGMGAGVTFILIGSAGIFLDMAF